MVAWLFLAVMTSAWSQNLEDLKKQFVTEAKAAHATNMERLSTSAEDCKVPIRQFHRLKVLRANVLNLEKIGGLTHCPQLTDQNPQSESYKLWTEARVLEQASTTGNLDVRKMWAQTQKEEFVRPTSPAMPVTAAPTKKSNVVENKKCEVLVLDGSSSGIANHVPTRESCEALCQEARAKGSVRCYYGPDSL